MSEKEIEIRYGFVANEEFAHKFFTNAIDTEVAYLLPHNGCPSTTSCRFRRRNGKATMTCKTSDGKGSNNIERVECEMEISNESFEAFTEKLPIMHFYFYKDEFGREFKAFEKSTGQQKFIVEKEFDHVPAPAEISEFTGSLCNLGHSIYDMSDNFSVNMSKRYTEFLNKAN